MNKKKIFVGLFSCVLLAAIYVVADFTLRTESGDLVLDPTSGKVGIGNADPATSLDVNGSARLAGDLTLSGSELKVYFVDTALSSPEGRFRVFSGADLFSIQGRNAADDDYENVIRMERIADGGIVIVYGTDGLKVDSGPLNVDSNSIINALNVESSGGGLFFKTKSGDGNSILFYTRGSDNATLKTRVTLTGGVITGDVDVSNANLDLNNNNITNVDKITYTSADPIFRIDGNFYSTWALESPAHEVTLSGTSRLTDGVAVIDLENSEEGSKEWLYSKIAVNTRAFVTPLSACMLYVTEQSERRVVVESDECGDAGFNWRLVGDRIDNVVEDTGTAMNVTIATDVALKETIFYRPVEFKEVLAGYEYVNVDDDTMIKKPVYEQIPTKWEWMPRSKQ